MRLLIVYVLLVVAGVFVAVKIGFYLDTAMPILSMPISLGMFFAVLLFMWPLAVYITERWWNPKSN
jgi:hypothetical protein